jgi:hypoxanthine phosphoribosyltransferase
MPDQLKTVIDSQTLHARVAELGAQVAARYPADEPLVLVCVLKGAFLFFADLVRHVDRPMEFDFVRMSSYGSGTSRAGKTIFSKDMEVDIAGKHVLVVEDVVDTGHSVQFLLGVLSTRGAKSVAVCAAVDKRERREVDVTVDFAGFTIQKGFIVGYGMDYAEKYRELDAIYELVPQQG